MIFRIPVLFFFCIFNDTSIGISSGSGVGIRFIIKCICCGTKIGRSIGIDTDIGSGVGISWEYFALTPTATAKHSCGANDSWL